MTDLTAKLWRVSKAADYNEDDYIQLSGIQHFAFCPRQWALIHIEEQWQENWHTTLGEILHERAHSEGLTEKRGNTITMRGMRVSSRELGTVGQCDIVEFVKADTGITLNKYDGFWQVFPVEYKKGRTKTGDEDRLQLCAQAICLEEMLLCTINCGFLYYGETKRREKVILDEDLRLKTKECFITMKDLLKKGHTPKAKKSAKCRSCSLNDICLPQLSKTPPPEEYISRAIGGDDV